VLLACAAIVRGGPTSSWGRDRGPRASRTAAYAHPREAGALVRDDAGALAEVLVHYVADLEPLFADATTDFLSTLSPETRLVVVIRRGERLRLDAFLARVDGSGALARRTRVVEVEVPIGIWSKDRALVLSPSSRDGGRTELLVPPRPLPGRASRPGDWEIVPSIAREMPDRYEVRRLPLAFDAGDFTVVGERVLVDTNLLARNASRGLGSPRELGERLASLLGREVVVLGEAVGDVPRHHMSMYMAALDGGVALVGDPAAGARIVGSGFAPGERSLESGEPLRADFSGEVIARFDRAAAELSRAGFRVIRIPTVPFDDKTYFAYTNGVYETRAGRRIAWMPTFGVPSLDDAARAVYEELGWTVVPVRVRALYMEHGTIGCLAMVLARSR
jgi:hypothetical protein